MWGLLLAAVLIALVLTGCRAFVPEAVIVNKAPETYIVGAPVENAGGYYHFHVFWYGSDADGEVARFVWALTDTTLQDPDTTDDEEDQNFNPALDASTLAIGHWTTKTDSIFDFRIDQGTRPSADFTLHMVAQDDMGAYDRTPARLHFFSNTLGNPQLHFFRVEGTDTIPLATGATDTVGYRKPYTVTWRGETPNIIGYDPTMLARVDTVYPFDDGLFGYKWQITTQYLLPDGRVCDETATDCWHPRLFDEAQGDSFSYFGSVTSLSFANNDAASTNPFKRILRSSTVNLLVNSIDVAGVEVAEYQRAFSFQVNYYPETLVLNHEKDWAHPEDQQVYPYYIRLNDPTQTKVPFAQGDRIPDRTYVVVKALARDNPKDTRINPDFGIGLSGFVVDTLHFSSGAEFGVTTQSSALDTTPTWGAGVDGWYADTLGLLVSPRSTVYFNMQAMDEHGRKDGSPARIHFDVGYPPCVQCVEVKPRVENLAADPDSVDCVDPVTGMNACFEDTASIYFSSLNDDTAGEMDGPTSNYSIIIKKAGFYTEVVQDASPYRETHYIIPASIYTMRIYMHAADDSLEAWRKPEWRTMAWRYQVDHECDLYNQVKDGGGNDDITRVTWGNKDNPLIQIDPQTGVWSMDVEVAVPTALISSFRAYCAQLLSIAGLDADLAAKLFTLSVRQLGEGSIKVIALDQTGCDYPPNGRPASFNWFEQVRPTTRPSSLTWRSCDGLDGVDGSVDLMRVAMESRNLLPEASRPVTKYFRIIGRMRDPITHEITGLIDCHTEFVDPRNPTAAQQ